MFINTTRLFPEGAVLKVKFRLAHLSYGVSTRREVRSPARRRYWYGVCVNLSPIAARD
jgi:hypothetical protein